MIVFVSTTSFTRPPLLPHGVHLGLNFLFEHWFTGLRANAVQHLVQLGSNLATTQFGGEQIAEGSGFD
jgi:hypothetical protein